MAAEDGKLICPGCNFDVLDEDKAVQCKGFCRFWYHCKCVKILDNEYEFMKSLGEKSRWLCSPCGLRLDSLVKNVCDFDSIIQLNSTVSKLCAIVKGVVNDNIILNKKIDDVVACTSNLVGANLHGKQEVAVCSVNEIESGEILSQSFERTNTKSQTAESRTLLKERSDIELTAADDSVTEQEEELSNLAESGLSKQPLSYSTAVQSRVKVTSSRSKSGSGSGVLRAQGLVSDKAKRTIIGSNASKSGLKPAERKSWIFVSRCDINTTAEELIGYLKDSGLGEVSCEKLKTKHNQCSSFKVSVPENNFNTVLKDDFWPQGIFVKEFEFPRNIFRSEFRSKSHPNFLDRRK